MTKEERKRALLLERVLREYGQTGIMNRLLIFAVIAILLIDMMLLFSAASDDELYMLLPFHVFMTTLFLGSMSYITTSLVGDVQSFYGNNNMNIVLGGSMKTGDFLSVLPFQAKDMLRLRVKNFQKQLCTSVVTTLIVQVICMLADKAGYEMYYGFGALAIIALVLYELIMMSAVFMKRVIPVMLTTVAASAMPMLSFAIFAFVEDDAEKIAELVKALEALGFLSKVPGMIILAICGFAIMLLAEKIAEKKQGVSWNMR